MAKCLEGYDFVQITMPGEQRTIFMQVNRPNVIGLFAFVDQRNTDEIDAFMRDLANGKVLAKVPGYSIFVLPGGTITGEQVDSCESRRALEKMASFFLSDIIGLKRGRWLKYQEGADMNAVLEKGRYYKQLREARRAAKLSQEEE